MVGERFMIVGIISIIIMSYMHVGAFWLGGVMVQWGRFGKGAFLCLGVLTRSL